jgi:hypothetical protein
LSEIQTLHGDLGDLVAMLLLGLLADAIPLRVARLDKEQELRELLATQAAYAAPLILLRSSWRRRSTRL